MKILPQSSLGGRESSLLSVVCIVCPLLPTLDTLGRLLWLTWCPPQISSPLLHRCLQLIPLHKRSDLPLPDLERALGIGIPY